MVSTSRDTRKILKKGFSSAAKAEQEVCGCEMERRAMSVLIKFSAKLGKWPLKMIKAQPIGPSQTWVERCSAVLRMAVLL